MESFVLLVAAASAAAVYTVSSLPARKYHFVYDPKSWYDARTFCRQQYTDLATIDNMADVAVLNNMADVQQMVYSQSSYRAWIGLYADMNKWNWSESDAAFRSWKSGEPDNYLYRENCVGMTDQGLWFDVVCERLNVPVCSERNGQNVTFVPVQLTMNWTTAQNYCREHHTDLATITGQTDNQRVKELVPAGKAVWISLYRKLWEWMDGSHFLFTHWKFGEPNGKSNTDICAVVNFQESGSWEDESCGLQKPFICHQAPVKLKVLDVKLVRTSSLDLEEPAVLAEMLKQLEVKLQQQAGSPQVKVHWRKQTDGKIFHKLNDV